MLWLSVALRHPRAWVFAIPALAPALNFAPWTGWVVFEEFDLLVLGAAAAGHARLALASPSPWQARVRSIGRWGAGLASVTGVSMVLGFADAGGFWFGWFQGYLDPLNSVRLAKPVLWACLLAPLLVDALGTARTATLRRFAGGMVCGLALVSAAALWERAAYPGVWEFTQPYRTVALFWEMHVGGAAIDAYLALAIPFSVWLLWAARRPLHWGFAAALALLAGYACLTTFSRGLYVAMAVSAVLLGTLARSRGWAPLPSPSATKPARHAGQALLALVVLALLYLVADRHGAAAGVGAGVVIAVGAGLLRPWRPGGWRRPASLALGLAFSLEVLLVFGPDSFMLNRLVASEQDSGSRFTHWRNGLALLSTPAEWAWGIGLGRLPARYASQVTDAEFSGAVQPVDAAAPGHGTAVRLAGPRTRGELGGRYHLSQRIPSHSAYRLQFDVRGSPGTVIGVRVCHSHLLYASGCHTAALVLASAGQEWQRHTLTLHRPAEVAPGSWPPRQAVFGAAVGNAGGAAELTNLQLAAPDGAPLLRNGDFSAGLAHWLPTATTYFVPWHIDSMALEVLIERGVAGIVAIGGSLALGIAGLGRTARREPLAAVMLASLAAWLTVGLVSSLLDAPRVALLAMLIVLCGVLARDLGSTLPRRADLAGAD